MGQQLPAQDALNLLYLIDLIGFGAPGEIRTPDRLVRSLVGALATFIYQQVMTPAQHQNESQ